MLFSSLIFLYLFLPVTLLVYYCASGQLKNYWLLFASLVFFAWGGISFTIVLAFSIIVNYFFGLMVGKFRASPFRKFWITLGVSVNILILGVFKYAHFAIHSLNQIYRIIGLPEADEPSIALPIGISFYTFHSISYLVDIYRGKTPPQKNLVFLALYICMFSQLIAGPIIRYSDVSWQLTMRRHNIVRFVTGIKRFAIGLGKKVLIANTFAHIADDIFIADYNSLAIINAWLGAVAYTIQIYCDFSGYSDMAIGLGKMFGFEFKENFNYPYMARSVQEFWRRWHISLSSFFRDYVYIPLGGNRVPATRQYLNLIAVFILTGLWHGSYWTFVIWGLFHGFFLLLERLFLAKALKSSWKPLRTFYTLLVVVFAWVLFRCDYLSNAVNFYKAMFNFHISEDQLDYFFSFLNSEVYLAFILFVAGAFGFLESLKKKVASAIEKGPLVAKFTFDMCVSVSYLALLILCSCYLIAGTYNPFIYYKF